MGKPFANQRIAGRLIVMFNSSEASVRSTRAAARLENQRRRGRANRSNAKQALRTPAKLHDKQSERDYRDLRIDKVGVRGLRFPIQVRDKARAVQDTVATIGMFVDLPKEFKGTHMSRFIEVLNAHGDIVHVENITDILHAMQKKLHADTAHLEMEFPFFLSKKAPVSGMEGVMDY